jgi:hypothetical protein
MNTKRAEQIYNKIKEDLKGKEGKIVAIDPESGDYFIGNDVLDACDKGREKHPNREFLFKRVGAKAVYHIL